MNYNNINETDQWLLDGNCSKCRRNNYCKNRCKKSKQLFQREVIRAIDKSTHGAYSTIMNYVYRTPYKG